MGYIVIDPYDPIISKLALNKQIYLFKDTYAWVIIDQWKIKYFTEYLKAIEYILINHNDSILVFTRDKNTIEQLKLYRRVTGVFIE